jgi:hypothetical protein
LDPNFHLFFFGVEKIKILLKKRQSSDPIADTRTALRGHVVFFFNIFDNEPETGTLSSACRRCRWHYSRDGFALFFLRIRANSSAGFALFFRRVRINSGGRLAFFLRYFCNNIGPRIVQRNRRGIRGGERSRGPNHHRSALVLRVYLRNRSIHAQATPSLNLGICAEL